MKCKRTPHKRGVRACSEIPQAKKARRLTPLLNSTSRCLEAQRNHAHNVRTLKRSYGRDVGDLLHRRTDDVQSRRRGPDRQHLYRAQVEGSALKRNRLAIRRFGRGQGGNRRLEGKRRLIVDSDENRQAGM
jgi:hypothetical protein